MPVVLWSHETGETEVTGGNLAEFVKKAKLANGLNGFYNEKR